MCAKREIFFFFHSLVENFRSVFIGRSFVEVWFRHHSLAHFISRSSVGKCHHFLLTLIFFVQPRKQSFVYILYFLSSRRVLLCIQKKIQFPDSSKIVCSVVGTIRCHKKLLLLHPRRRILDEAENKKNNSVNSGNRGLNPVRHIREWRKKRKIN